MTTKNTSKRDWSQIAKNLTIYEILDEIHAEAMLQATQGQTTDRRDKQDALRLAAVKQTEQAQVEILEIKDVWIVWTNTDLTEGRGRQYPLYVCENKITAQRMAKKQYVMGTDAPVEESKAYRIKINDGWHGTAWCGPVNMIEPKPNDLVRDEAKTEFEQALESAKEAGLSVEQLDALKRAGNPKSLKQRGAEMRRNRN